VIVHHPAVGGDAVAPGGLDVVALGALLARPPLLAPHGAPFWDDRHVGEGMLEAHLDPDREAASRAHDRIDREVAWLVDALGLTPGRDVLDLGCGPGLYCTRLARRGLAVTGVDVSPVSIDHARGRAEADGLPIVYERLDYRALDRTAAFDAALMVYFDLGVLPDADRDEVLRRVHRALRPGGAFAFDVLTPHALRRREERRSWAVRPSGFWRPGPYLELTASYRYPEDDAFCTQTAIVDPNGRATVYRMWDRGYTPATLAPVLEAAGLLLEGRWADLTGAAYRDDSDGLAALARKR
jgi:SAM-dependent methyltransferase